MIYQGTTGGRKEKAIIIKNQNINYWVTNQKIDNGMYNFSLPNSGIHQNHPYIPSSFYALIKTKKHNHAMMVRKKGGRD
jgi:hypothetical protein